MYVYVHTCVLQQVKSFSYQTGFFFKMHFIEILEIYTKL